MADPLKLLREYIITNRSIKERDDYIIFGDIAFPKGAKTNHVVFSKKDEYYTLESLYFFYKKRSLAHTAYVKEAAAKNIQVVTRPDRKGLEDYLTKEKLESNIKPNIDHSAPLPASIHVSRLQLSSAPSASAIDHSAEGPPDAKRARFENDKLKDKERLRAAEGKGAGTAEDLRGLSDDLTKEKIAALRSKAMARKQKNIKNVDEDLDAAAAAGGVGGGGAAVTGLAGESRRYMDAGQADLAREVTRRERVWRTRTTVMEAASKNFAKSILPVLQTLKIREEGGRMPANDSSASRSGAAASMDASRMGGGGASRPLAPHQQQGYNRYDQERFRKEETEGFKIDTMGTYHGVALTAITAGAKPKQQTSQAPADSNSTTSSYDRIAETMNSTATSQYEGDANRPQKRVSRTPIIIIPGAGASLVTIYNVKELLQDLKYISTDEKKAQGTRRENEVLIQRQKEGSATVPYRVIDNPSKLTPDEWDRVVAVFVQGPQWQFKGWPWHGNPVEIFEKVAAFHLKWDDVKLDANVSKWAVNIIQLSRNKRHLDRASLLKFWDSLGRHILKHKPYLRH